MRIKSVRVLGVSYPVVEPTDGVLDAVPAFGCAEGRQVRAVFINPAQAETMKLQTLLHEVLHIYDDRLGMGLGEKKVTGVSEVVFALLADNPDIVAAIQGLAKDGIPLDNP